MATRSPPAGSRALLLLVCILACGLALRAWYASHDPGRGRFYDERFALENVDAILDQGTLAPPRGYYPSPVFNLPPAALLGAADAVADRTGAEGLRPRGAEGTRPAGYLIVRMLQVAYGTFTLLLVFVVARALFPESAEAAGPATGTGEMVGLVAALVLAFVPWHVHVSSHFKPDALLTLTVLLAFWWSLRAFERPAAGRFALAGVGVALAASSKLTGAVIAVPLAVGTLLAPGRPGRRLGLLVLAAAISIAVFILLNPYWMHYPAGLAALQREYAWKPQQEESPLGVARQVVNLVLDRYGHGPLLGAAGLIAWVALAAGLLRSGRDRRERARVAMFLSFPLVYALAYVTATSHFKANHFAPLFPFTALLAAWLLARLWRLGASRWRALARPAAAAVAVAALVGVAATPGWLYVYRSLTPETLNAALEFLRPSLRLPGAVVVAEAWPRSEPAWEGGLPWIGKIALRFVSRLESTDAERLDLADGEVFQTRHLDGPRADFYRSRIARVHPSEMAVFRPRPLVARGPAVTVVRHGWKRAGRVEELTLAPAGSGSACAGTRFKKRPPGQTASVTVHLPAAALDPTGPPPSATVAGREVGLVWMSYDARGHLFTTERFRARGRVRICLAGIAAAADPRVPIRLQRWRPRKRGLTEPVARTPPAAAARPVGPT